MTTTNTPYNPIFRATRAAVAELTTPDARRWYRAQSKAMAAMAMVIAHKSTATVEQWLKPKPVPEVVADTGTEKIALAEATAPEQTNAPAVWAALEANDSAAVDEPAQAIALHPEYAAGEVQPEASELEQEPTPTSWAWAATDEDEPLPEADEAKEPAPTQLPSDLSSLIQDYLQQKNRISSESVGEEAIAHSSPAPADSTGEAAVFAWEEHQVDSDRAAGADAGE
jgi:hypothetical protein